LKDDPCGEATAAVQSIPMTIDPLKPQDPSAIDADQPHASDMTVDLTLDGLDGLDDLQAVADAAADELPEYSPEVEALDDALPGESIDGTTSPNSEEVSDYLNAELEATLKEALERIQELEKHETEHQDKHHRLLADFSNYRNRTAREIQMAVDQAEQKLLREFLPVLDNFDRGLASNYQSVEDFRAGVELIRKQFVDALHRMDVEAIPIEIGDPFDAQHAEALTTLVNPTLADGAIADIFEKGFTLRGQLLRPARVVVNRVE